MQIGWLDDCFDVWLKDWSERDGKLYGKNDCTSTKNYKRMREIPDPPSPRGQSPPWIRYKFRKNPR